jgi:hypothetical protein
MRRNPFVRPLRRNSGHSIWEWKGKFFVLDANRLQIPGMSFASRSDAEAAVARLGGSPARSESAPQPLAALSSGAASRAVFPNWDFAALSRVSPYDSAKFVKYQSSTLPAGWTADAEGEYDYQESRPYATFSATTGRKVVRDRLTGGWRVDGEAWVPMPLGQAMLMAEVGHVPLSLTYTSDSYTLKRQRNGCASVELFGFNKPFDVPQMWSAPSVSDGPVSERNMNWSDQPTVVEFSVPGGLTVRITAVFEWHTATAGVHSGTTGKVKLKRLSGTLSGHGLEAVLFDSPPSGYDYDSIQNALNGAAAAAAFYADKAFEVARRNPSRYPPRRH